MNHLDVTGAHIEDVLSDRIWRVERQCEDVWGRCLQTITVGAEGAGRSSEWVGFECNVSAGVDEGLLWNFCPRDLAKETHHAMTFCFCRSLRLAHVCPQAQILSGTHRIYAQAKRVKSLKAAPVCVFSLKRQSGSERFLLPDGELWLLLGGRQGGFWSAAHMTSWLSSHVVRQIIFKRDGTREDRGHECNVTMCSSATSQLTVFEENSYAISIPFSSRWVTWKQFPYHHCFSVLNCESKKILIRIQLLMLIIPGIYLHLTTLFYCLCDSELKLQTNLKLLHWNDSSIKPSPYSVLRLVFWETHLNNNDLAVWQVIQVQFCSPHHLFV